MPDGKRDGMLRKALWTGLYAGLVERAAPLGGLRSGGPSPWLVLGGALAVGVLTAKAIDWRGHAHPRY